MSAALVVVEGVQFLSFTSDAATVYTRPSVDPKQLQEVVEVVDTAAKQVPGLTGVRSPVERTPLYVFPSKDEFVTYTQQIQGRTINNLSSNAGSWSIWPGGKYPGIFHAASAGSSILTANYTWQYVGELTGGQGEIARRQEGRWFAVSVGWYLAYLILREKDQTARDRNYVSTILTVLGAEHDEALVKLTDMETPWNTSAERENTIIAEGVLAVTQLIRGRGFQQVSRALIATGNGTPWKQAFSETFGQSEQDFQTSFFASLQTLVPAAVPASLQSGKAGTVFVVFAGFQPNGSWTGTLYRPGGQPNGTYKGEANSYGFVSFGVGFGADSVRGIWSVEVSGAGVKPAKVAFTIEGERQAG